MTHEPVFRGVTIGNLYRWFAPAGWMVLLFPWTSCAQAPPNNREPIVTLDELDQATRARLEQAQQYLAARQWEEAVATLRRVMEGDGRRLIALPDAADAPLVRYVTLRRYGQALLSRWSATSPEAFATYRHAVEPAARQALQSALPSLDRSALEQIVESYFVTDAGAEAAAALGEIYLERGDTLLARNYWERLHPAARFLRSFDPASRRPAARPLWLAIPASSSHESEATGTASPPTWEQVVEAAENARPTMSFLSHPRAAVPLPDVYARLVLVSLVERHWERAERELNWLRHLYPEAVGTLAGREGKWVELLESLLTSARETPPPPTSGDWPTFAGDPTRDHIVRASIDIGGPPLWRLALPRLTGDNDSFGESHVRIAEDASGLLSYFPVVIGRGVFIAQPDALRAVDLYRGEPLFPSAMASSDATQRGVFFEGPRARPDIARGNEPILGVPRYTLTGCNQYLFARLGSPFTRYAGQIDLTPRIPGYIAGCDLSAEGRLLDAFPLQTSGPEWVFEGTPCCDGARIYVAMRKQDEIHVEFHLAAYDLASGRQVWTQFLCAAETPGQGRLNEVSHNLLTLKQGIVFANTNLGVVAAVQARDGHLLWVTRYPRSGWGNRLPETSSAHFFRSLNPPLIAGGVVVVAPTDSPRLFALDAVSGQTLWATPAHQADDVVHLLGTAHGRLIAGGDYLYWWDLFTGELQGQFPPRQRDEPGFVRPSPRGYGRGLLAGNEVYWPTREALYIFAQRPVRREWGWEPLPAGAPRSWSTYGVQPGNLVAAEHVLLIAGADELSALRW